MAYLAYRPDIETPEPNAERVTIYGLLDGASATGAFRFDLFPLLFTLEFNVYVQLGREKVGHDC